MMTQTSKPKDLATEADCRQLAEYEWEQELDPKSRGDRQKYVEARAAHLAASHVQPAPKAEKK